MNVLAVGVFALLENNQGTIEQMILGIFTIKKEVAEPTDDQGSVETH